VRFVDDRLTAHNEQVAPRMADQAIAIAARKPEANS